MRAQEMLEGMGLVAKRGCDRVQGYCFSRPLPFDNLVKWLHDRTSLKF